jgi:phage FluMu gp28-like protein
VQRNQQILEEFKTRMQAEVDLTGLDVNIAEHALKAYTAMAEVFRVESEQKLNAAKFEFEKAFEDAKLELEQTRLHYDKEFKALELEMTRVKAVAEISLSGAKVNGDIGSAAMSVMNTMTQLSAAVSG